MKKSTSWGPWPSPSPRGRDASEVPAIRAIQDGACLARVPFSLESDLDLGLRVEGAAGVGVLIEVDRYLRAVLHQKLTMFGVLTWKAR